MNSGPMEIVQNLFPFKLRILFYKVNILEMGGFCYSIQVFMLAYSCSVLYLNKNTYVLFRLKTEPWERYIKASNDDLY